MVSGAEAWYNGGVGGASGPATTEGNTTMTKSVPAMTISVTLTEDETMGLLVDLAVASEVGEEAQKEGRQDLMRKLGFTDEQIAEWDPLLMAHNWDEEDDWDQ